MAAPDRPETVLDEAQRIIYGDRERTYGHPSKNFDNTATLWTAWTVAKYGTGLLFDAEDVAMMQVLLKIARQAHEHKRDNLVDICGYTACIQKIIDYGAKTRNDVPERSREVPPDVAAPRKDEQSLPQRDRRFMVQREQAGPVDRVQVHDATEDRAGSLTASFISPAANLARR